MGDLEHVVLQHLPNSTTCCAETGHDHEPQNERKADLAG